MTLKQQIKKARDTYFKSRSNTNLRRYLTLKARAGIYDKRMCAYYGVNPKVNRGCRKAVCRAYVAGLVPTATTGGVHAPGSWHFRLNSKGEGSAVDFGLRASEVGTAAGQRKLEIFQRKEFWRNRRNQSPGLVELIGPRNGRIVLKGVETTLAEGSALENAHDNHVHEAYRV